MNASTNPQNVEDKPGVRNGDAPGNGDAPKNGDNENKHGRAAQGAPAGKHDENIEGAIPDDLPRPSAFAAMSVGVVLVLFMVGLFFIGWFPLKHREGQAEQDASDIANDKPVVKVISPTPTKSEVDVVLPADITPWQTTDLFPRISGYLERLDHDINDHVKAGDELAKIAAPEVDAELAQAQAQLDQFEAALPKAEADVVLAQATLDRDLKANQSNSGSVPEETVDQAKDTLADNQSAFKVAQANVATGQANVQQLQAQVSFETISAPFSGVITARNYDLGALLNPSTTSTAKPIFSMQNIDTMRVFISVPQIYADNLRIGQDAFLSVRNFPGHEFKGTVTRTTGSLDPTTRTIMVEVDVKNADPTGTLYGGMYGSVRLPIKESAQSLTIPTASLVFNAGGLQVAMVQDEGNGQGKVSFKQVKTGRDNGTEIEILGDTLKSTDVLIANPGERIVEGSEVTIEGQNQPQSASAGGATTAMATSK
jgi:RND family efflux transporter MFP subunit